MPKPRKNGNSSKTGSNQSNSATPRPLLDCLRGQSQTPPTDSSFETDSIPLATSGWKCDPKDWSSVNTTDNKKEKFPSTLRSIERKHLEMKNPFHPTNTSESDDNTSLDDQQHWISSTKIDLTQLSTIVSDLINQQRDQEAYIEFLSILKHYSVQSKRNDHLEDTIYHLIQAAVTYIRRNEQRFDLNQLHECYRQRHCLRMNTVQ